MTPSVRSIGALLLLAPAFAAAQTAPPERVSIVVAPSRPAPGALVRLTLRAAAADSGAPGDSSDSITSVTGSMGGEPLHFLRASDSAWHAVGVVPVDAARSVTARVEVRQSDGSTAALRLEVPVPPIPKRRTEPLTVDTSFTEAPDPARVARIARENALARTVGRRAHDSPPLWTQGFLRPRTSVITSVFGSGRVFNGQLTTRHLGVDFRGRVGEPVRAANRGVVALVDSFVLAGNVVYIDHGAGVVTGYFHLSRTLVARGDTVARGQVIGEVGETGRVTGPHLHWTARYGETTANPLDLLSIGPAWYSASVDRAAPGAAVPQ